MAEPSICQPGGGGLFLPLGDHSWDANLRACLYFVGLVYCFFGVAIVADMFMGAIEAITKRRKQRKLQNGQTVTTYFWNATVANLTLMALGSSAPEIFLSVIDLFRTGMHSSDLGSSTIVGSAAFNLLVIVSVCIVCIPDGEVRLIEQYAVFIVTGVFSLFAYMWLVLILVVISPDRVEVWEAVLTLLAFPVLIGVSYAADLGRHGLGLSGAAKDAESGKASAWFASSASTASTTTPASTPGAAAETSTTKTFDEGGDFTICDEGLACVPKSSECDLANRRKVVLPAEGESEGQGDIQSDGTAPKWTRGLSFIRGTSQGSRSAGSVSASKSSTKTSLVRGFSIRSFTSGSGEDESFPKSSARRKSIAHHHSKLGMNRLRRGTTSLGSRIMDDIDLAGILPDDRLASVQMLVDRQYASTSMPTKLVKVLRTGAPVTLCVEYKIDRCTKPVPTVRDTEVQCALSPERRAADGATTGEDVVDWVAEAETEEEPVMTGFITLDASSDEQTIACETMPLDGGCGDFIVSLLDAKVVGPVAATVTLGDIRSSYVMSTSEDGSWLLFASQTMSIPGSLQPAVVEAVVCRIGGSGELTQCVYSTEGLTAMPGIDYVPEEQGSLTFPTGVTEMRIRLQTLPKQRHTIPRKLLLVLKPPEDDDLDPGATPARFVEDHDGGDHSAIMTIWIDEVPEFPAKGVRKIVDKMVNLSSLQKGVAEWKEQCRSAVLVNGSWEAQRESSVWDRTFHVASVPWLLGFSTIPPASFFGGWACFWVCLIWIGAVTAVIADLAELFGCVLGVPDMITAITFVALGTSMPDLFASKVAATEDPTADASIVNVTGSNSVNVFLGLGLPWTVAAIYWGSWDRSPEWLAKYPDVAAMYPQTKAVFVVPSASLGFSVIVFCCTCVGAMLILVLRRRRIGGELGGSARSKYACAVTFLLYWLGYIGLVSWRALRLGKTTWEEDAVVLGGVFVVELVATAVAVALILNEGGPTRDMDVKDASMEDAGAPKAGVLRASSTTSLASRLSVPSEPRPKIVAASPSFNMGSRPVRTSYKI